MRIADRYTVGEMLGEGGFGVVHRAHDEQLGRDVAIKMTRKELSDQNALRKFASEGRKLAAFSDPNIVQVFDSGVHEGRPYIVMELLHGSKLRDIIDGGELAPHRALGVMAEVASGLHAVHSAGMAHLDLSTNNVMVLDNGRAKILDFGLAKGFTSSFQTTTSGSLAGTPSYMAPEQLQGHAGSFPADIFVYGVILYQALTGVYPFGGEHPQAILYAIVNREPRPLADHMDDCPAELASLVQACLEKDPDARPESMSLVSRTIAQVLAAGTFSDRPVTTPLSIKRVSPRDTRRNPYLNRVMIKRRRDFFGRRREIKRICSRLNATPPGSVSVVGERKIGKSSLLNHIYLKQNRHDYLEEPEKTIMVFLDFQQEHSMSLTTFVQTLLGIAALELDGRLDIASCTSDLEGLRKFVQLLNENGFRLAILMDEFESVTKNPNFDLEFFSFLRYIANRYDVAYLTSSARDLQILCHTQEIADSPFFNIFTTMRLGLFDDEEALELVTAPSTRIGLPLDGFSEEIIALAGRFPFFLQMACSHAIELLEENEEQPLRLADVDDRFFQEASQHFNYIWDHTLDDAERKALAKIAHGKKMPEHLQHVVEELTRKSYVTATNSRVELFSTAFRTFVQSQDNKGGGGFFRRFLGGSG